MPRKEQFYRCNECTLSGPCYACSPNWEKPRGCLQREERFPDWQPAYPPEPEETGTKLRLVLTHVCERSCPGCCNKDIDWKKVRTFDFDFELYDEILLTGGEPLLVPFRVSEVIKEARSRNPKTQIVLYTARLDNFELLASMMQLCDGVTITVHEAADLELFRRFVTYWERYIDHDRRICPRLRVNVFEEAGQLDLYATAETPWRVKQNMKWLKNCPLPDGEVLMVHPKCLQEVSHGTTTDTTR